MMSPDDLNISMPEVLHAARLTCCGALLPRIVMKHSRWQAGISVSGVQGITHLICKRSAFRGTDFGRNLYSQRSTRNVKAWRVTQAHHLPGMEVVISMHCGLCVQVTYEAYGAGGTGFIAECLTDNVNRSATDVRTAIVKAGGKMADSGSVLFNFQRCGVVMVVGSSEEKVGPLRV